MFLDSAPKSSLYRFLGRLWVREIDAPVLMLLGQGLLSDAYAGIGGTLPPEGDATKVCEVLGAEYRKLFVGPNGHLPLYQSAWKTACCPEDAGRSMQTYFDKLGYLPPWTDSTRHRIETGAARKLNLDHLGIQLDCFGHLSAALDQADNSDRALREALREIATGFFRNHFCWPSRLFQLTQERAETNFYRSLAVVTERVLTGEAGEWEVTR